MKISCRICDHNLYERVFFIEEMPLTDDFISISNKNKKEYLSDITIYRCENCGVVQNPIDFNHEAYYEDYKYSSAHSQFVQKFMSSYARVTLDLYQKENNKASSILEIGSGDGEQLSHYKTFGIQNILGIEPSKYLADLANKQGINTMVDLFELDTPSKIKDKFDICLSSFTFDHVREPLNYLNAAHSLLNESGILALEIHDLEKMINRTEYCLFEHEHTIYLTSNDITHILENSGFSVISINPIDQKNVRGNSMIVIAKKENLHKRNFKRTIKKILKIFKQKSIIQLLKSIIG